MVALKRQQRKRSKWHLAHLTAAFAVVLGFLSFSRLGTLTSCDRDVNMEVGNPSLLSNGRKYTPSLASRQSYGFFDDIQDDSWKLMQERARSSISYADQENPEAFHENAMYWLMSNLMPDFTCPLKSRVKRYGDGPNYTCDPHRLRKQKDCLIYSIGSEGDYEWEEALINIVGGRNHCEIHVFGAGKHARTGDPESKNIHYHQWVMKSSYDTVYNAAIARNHSTAHTASFPEMIERLGHQNRTINVLKMDCENCEWSNYKDWISADIRQILIETHGIPSPDSGNEWHHAPMNVSDFFDAFTENDFAMFSKETNMHGEGTGIEFGFVKLHPDFWGSTGKLPGPDDPKLLQMDYLKEVPILRAPPSSTSKIPPLAVFVHKTQILETQDPLDAFRNTERTISTFLEAWGETQASFTILDDLHCLAAIHEVREELVPFYRKEQDKIRRVELCRVAALYLTGGYYFAVDFELGNLTLPDDNVSLFLARTGGDLSKKFIASEQRSSVMSLALDNMLGYYKGEARHFNDPLTEAIRSMETKVQFKVVFLEDIGEEMSTANNLDLRSSDIFVDNPLPIDMQGPPSQDFKIPRRMIFTYKHNILETKNPPLLYENVISTIDKYREAWGEPNAPVWFLDDADCQRVIRFAKVNLLTYFSSEIRGSWKDDICRVAALYLTGGYSFDVDMEVVQPWKHGKDIVFATAAANRTNKFVQSFIASETEGRILKKTLSEMLLYYEKKQSRTQLMGPSTLKWAFDLVPISDRGETVILEETAFRRDEVESLERREAVGCSCDLGIRDPTTKQHAFYSRMVGAGPACMPKGTPEDQASRAAK